MRRSLKRSALVGMATFLIATSIFAPGSSAQEGNSSAPAEIHNSNTNIVFEPLGTKGLPVDQYKAFEQFAQQNPAIVNALTKSPALIRSKSFLKQNATLGDFLRVHPEVMADFSENPGNYVEMPLAVSAAQSSKESGGVAKSSVATSPVEADDSEIAPTERSTARTQPDESPAQELPSTSMKIPQGPSSSGSTVQEPELRSRASINPTPAITEYDDGIIHYEQATGPELNGPPVGSFQDFMSEGDTSSPLGIEVREDRRMASVGGEAYGLLIVDVVPDSPAARAGLHAYSTTPRAILDTITIAGAFFFPPAVLLVPVLDQVVDVKGSFDLIIGIDGSRVTNFVDFEDLLRDVRPGEIVYLNILRNGRRVQIPTQVPPGLP